MRRPTRAPSRVGDLDSSEAQRLAGERQAAPSLLGRFGGGGKKAQGSDVCRALHGLPGSRYEAAAGMSPRPHLVR